MINHITLMGRLTQEPEKRYTANNIPVTSFRVACDRDIKNRDGEKETDFINCVAWRQTADFVSKNFSKGSLILVEGRLQIRNYLTKDGDNRSITEVVAERVYFTGEKKHSEQDEKPVGAGAFAEIDDADGELPF